MAGMSVSSTFISFLILLAMAFSFFAQLTPVAADLKVRKLGAMASRPPSPGRNPAWGLVPSARRRSLLVDTSVVLDDLKVRKLGVMPSPPPSPAHNPPLSTFPPWHSFPPPTI